MTPLVNKYSPGTVLMIEPNLGGHRSVYLSKISEFFSERGADVIIVTLKGQVITQPMEKVLSLHPDIKIIFFDEDMSDFKNKTSLLSNVKREFYYWVLFRNIYNKVVDNYRVDSVFVPYMDYILYSIGLVGSPFLKTPFSGICMRPAFHFPRSGVEAPTGRMNLVKEFLFFRALKNKKLEKLYSIDELLVLYAQSNEQKLRNKIEFFPDPAEFVGGNTKSSARRVLNIRDEDSVVLIYGALDERKGVDKLIKGLNFVGVKNSPCLLFAGKQNEVIKEFLDCGFSKELKINNKLIELNRFLSEEEEQMCFAACDAVWLGYSSHYAMSSVLVKAAQMDKMIIGTSKGLIGFYVRNKNLGCLIEDEGFSFEKIVDYIKTFSPSKESEEFRLNYTWKSACNSLQGIINET